MAFVTISLVGFMPRKVHMNHVDCIVYAVGTVASFCALEVLQ